MTSPQHVQTQNQFGQQFFQYTDTPDDDGTNMNSTSEVRFRYDNDTMDKNKRRSRRVLSLKERIEVIRIAETRRDTRELAQKFECGRTQILSILSQKERLLKEWANNGDPNRLRRRPSAFSFTINKVIYEWLYRCKCALLPITDTDILEKAYEAKHFFKYSEFRPNKRWLDRFKNKFRLHHEDLQKPDPSFYDGVERSLELKNIYEEIKDTLEFSLQDSSQQSIDEIIGFENSIHNYDQTMSSSNNDNDVCEIADSDDQSCSAENFCETQFFTEEPSTNLDNKPISNDEQALECLKRLEEYSMLKDNFRAIGLIGQLEKIYKGQLES